jgi:hypothetical protein
VVESWLCREEEIPGRLGPHSRKGIPTNQRGNLIREEKTVVGKTKESERADNE